MPTQVQFRRGTATQNNAFTGAAGELSINSDNNSLRIHDGATAGGYELAKADLSNATGSISIQNLNVTGLSTFVGISTHQATLFGTQLSISGVTTSNAYYVGSTQVISSGRQLQNIASLDATTTATIESAVAAAPNDFTSLNITGISTLQGLLNVGVGGTVIATTSSGNVGLGTTNPTQKLDLNGNLRIRGGLYDTNNVVGAAGSVLSSTGSGVNWTSEYQVVSSGIGTYRDLQVKSVSADTLSVSGISTLGFFSDDQIITKNAILGDNTNYYSVHKNLTVKSGAVLSVGSGSTILLDRFNNLDNVTTKSVTSPFIMSYNRIQENFTVPANYNAMSVGPILTIDSGVVITVETNANWSVVPT